LDAMSRRTGDALHRKETVQRVKLHDKKAGVFKRVRFSRFETFEGGFIRGSINYQVNKIFVESGIFQPGTSKHTEKSIARENGAKTWADLGQRLSIYSYGTAETYKDTWHQCARWVKENLGVKDIEKLQPEHIKAYLETKIAAGVKYSSFERECAALAKFENALNMYATQAGKDTTYEFREAIKEIKQEASQVLDRTVETRAYESPNSVISAIRDEKYQVVASIQYEGGARLNEVWRIEKEDLKGIKQDPHTGKQIGAIEVVGKGGKEREIHVSPETYQAAASIIEKNGNLNFDKSEYREALKEAAIESGQDYHGSHGLRWNYAQEKMDELEKNTSMTYEERLQEVAWEMGHERADITEHYLHHR